MSAHRSVENIQNQTRYKILGIGLPKTGLTSLLSTMNMLGYNSCGRWSKLSKLFYKGKYDKILQVYDQYDFIVDHPTCLMYKLAFQRYGNNAKYILSLRRDPKVWFESLKRHQRYAHPIKNKHHKWFGRFYPHGFDSEHIDYYEAHQREVMRFFAEKGADDRLLVICVEEPGSFKKLLEFLDVESPMVEFPHENKSVVRTPSLSNQFKRRYNEVVQPLYARIIPKIRAKRPNQVLPPEPKD